MKKILIGAFLVFVFSLSCLWGVQSEETGRSLHPSRGPMKPPPEAIAACKGKSEGDAVQFSTSRGDTLKGVCKLFEGALTAMPPNGGPPPPRGMRPKEGGMDNLQGNAK